MPQFINPFSGMVPSRKLTPEELIRAIRQNLAAEEEATHLYTAHAEATDNPKARRILLDIADEERVHAGEFLRLLELLAPDEGTLLLQGASEVDQKTGIKRQSSGIEIEFNPLDPLGLFGPVRRDLKRLMPRSQG